MKSEASVAAGALIREARQKRGLRLKDLAALMGVHLVTICVWERGDDMPTVMRLHKLCAELKLDTETLLGLYEDHRTAAQRNRYG